MFRKIQFLIRDHFGFSGREANGFVIILFLMIFSLFLPTILSGFFSPPVYNNEKDKRKLDSITSLLEKNLQQDSIQKQLAYIEKYKSYPEKEKYFIFEKKAKNSYPEKNQIASVKIEINSASNAEWEKLNGIGPVLAERIVKFRNVLGGFYDLEQLKEVYGIDSLLFISIQKQLYLNADIPVKKISVKTASYESLHEHPYISKKDAVYILKGLKKYPDTKDCSFLLKDAVPPEKVNQICEYLSFE